MDYQKLKEKVLAYMRESGNRIQDLTQMDDRARFYQEWSRDRMLRMTGGEIHSYLRRLSALRIWNNKDHAIKKIIDENGHDSVRAALAELVWSDKPIESRWDDFRGKVKGVGPGIASELLMNTHPEQYMIYNSFVIAGLHTLGVVGLPSSNKITGEKYVEYCSLAKKIAEEIHLATNKSTNFLIVDHFLCTLS